MKGETGQKWAQKGVIKLKPRRREQWDTRSLSNNQKSGISTNELLSSISTKLNPKSISISSGDRRWSGITTQKVQIKVSCLDQLRVPKFYPTHFQNTLDFQELRRKAIRKKVKNLVTPLKCVGKGKKICSDPNCIIKQKWKNKLVLQLKYQKQAQHLKQMILNKQIHSSYDKQIEKDIARSFPSKESQKAKLTLYHATSQKQIIHENLETVLKMLSIADTDVGYIQGINLFTAIIISHTKQIQLSYVFTREVMKYGNMRKMYLNNFQQLRELCYHMLHRHIKILMEDLYEILQPAGVIGEIFMPFYLSMFACVVDYQYMVFVSLFQHSVIDQFMAKGFLFLDKLVLSMLAYMKNDLLDTDTAEIAYKLGASYIRSCEFPWDEIINLTQTFELN